MGRINFDLQELQAFVAVAERSSFKHAAEDLFLSQPALSRRIEKLEDLLGVKLFERTTRRVQLTNVGRIFLANVRNALDELEGAMLSVSDLAAHRTGVISLACVPSAVHYFLPGVLKSFTERFPKIRVRIHDESAQDVLNLVLAGEADFGINFAGAENPEIDFQPIYKEHFVLAVPQDHPLARRKKLTWKETARERYIAVAKSSGNRSLIDNALAGVEKHPTIYYEVNHVSGLLALVEAGMGVAAVPRLSLPANPRLVGIPLTEPVIQRTLGMISKRGRIMPPAAQTLFDMLVSSMAKNKRSLPK
ncbi:LysR family transcriptional regulator [Undibacterium sp. TC9W]|uniref:LysR family transcriptional regulator n=1 Tax=Undibacterium sp. TC9W TaxID=3413053 RepID=UPI003BF2D093